MTDDSGANVVNIGTDPQVGTPAEALQLINDADFAMVVTIKNGQWHWRVAKGQADKFRLMGALQQMIQVVSITR